jgi:hypothetical protein
MIQAIPDNIERRDARVPFVTPSCDIAASTQPRRTVAPNGVDIEASGGGGLEQPLPVADSFELRLSTKAEIPLTLFNSRERSDFRDKLLRKNTLGISVTLIDKWRCFLIAKWHGSKAARACRSWAEPRNRGGADIVAARD